MKKINEDLNKCKCLKGVSIEKRITGLMIEDAIDKKILGRMVNDGLLYTRYKKGEYDLLERDREFDEELVRMKKRQFKRGLKK